MDEHTILEHLGNLGVILLAVLLSTSVHYLFLRHLNRGARLALKFPQIRLGYGVIVSLIAHSIEVAMFAFAYKVSIESGFGALEADRTAEWFHGQLLDRGFGMRRTLLVDVHRCLAEAAHRCQPHEPVLVLTIHPNGDGVALASYRGSVGQLDKLWSQKGFASLHVHLKRCLAAMDLPRGDEALAWSLATQGVPDAALVRHLDGLLRADGPRLSRKRYPLPERPEAYAPLKQVPVEVAAASLLENLCGVVCALVQHHVQRSGLRRVALGGGVFENPWLVARVAELPEVDEVWTPPLQPRWLMAK